jgi:putative nucleotidyltransferase with HDIG domain
LTRSKYANPIFCATVFLTAVAMHFISGSFSAVNIRPLTFEVWLGFALLGTVQAFFAFTYKTSIRIAGSSIVQLTFVILFGPQYLMPFLIICYGVYFILYQRNVLKFLSNVGQLTLATYASSFIYFKLAGATATVYPPLLPVFPAAFVFWIINLTAVSFIRLFSNDVPFFETFSKSAGPHLPVCFLLPSVGIILAHVYITSLPVFILFNICLAVLFVFINRYFKMYDKLYASYSRTVNSLTSISELSDPETGRHSSRVATYAVMLAEALGLPRKEIEQIQIGALFHDIGKIAIRDEILGKSGPLTAEEYEIIKEHAQAGYEIAVKANLSQTVTDIIKYHHERYDGTGYPEGLKGNHIPYTARIIAIADCYDAMTSARSYRVTISQTEALRELKFTAGTQFDPRMVDAFVKCMGDNIRDNNWHRVSQFFQQRWVEDQG